MRAIILAAGNATRLRPLTDSIAKQLLPIGGRPMLDWVLDKLNTAGLDEIHLVTNARFADDFERWADGKDVVVHNDGTRWTNFSTFQVTAVTPNGDMDKLDEKLAARQIAWLADLATQLDGVSAEELRQVDPTLGGPTNPEGAPAASKKATCTPVAVGAATGTLTLRFLGRRKGGALLVELRALGLSVKGATVEVRRAGKVVARRRVEKIGAAPRRVLLRRAHRRKFTAGRYTLVVRRGKRTLARRTVRVR